MEKIRKNFGFGCMRLPMIGEDVDMEQTKQMVDCFLEQGFNYFDTAPGGGGENLAAIRNISGYGKVLSLRPYGAPPSQREARTLTPAQTSRDTAGNTRPFWPAARRGCRAR